MHREQTHHFLAGRNLAAWWLPLLLLALAVAFQVSVGSVAALADVEVAEQQQDDVEEVAEQEPAQESAETASEADSESESAGKDAAAAENKDDAEQDLKQDSEQSDADAKTNEAEPNAADSNDEGETENSKESSKVKSSADSAQQADGKGADGKGTDGKGTNEKRANEKTKDQQPNKATAQPTGDDQATVETERAVEVDPPQVDAEKDAEKSEPPKQQPKNKKCVIGATATLLEKQSELKFRARVDSGAKSCSLHFEKIKIEDESKLEDVAERMRENIGKVIHFEVKNGDDKTHILTSKIAGYVIIKTSDKATGKRRYKVPLTFRWKSTEKEVLVTLNKRDHMDYPLLLGRNFLRGDFLVDVELDSDD